MTKLRYISPFSVIVSFIALSLLGCALVPLLPVKLMPSQSLPAISVSFGMSGSSARVVESEATSRLESALNRISGVKQINSRSRNGGGSITIELDRNSDIEIARFEAAMIIRQLWSSLPDNVSYPHIEAGQVNSDAVAPFISYTINASQQPSEIIQYADDYIRPPLSRIPGVAKVELSGVTPFEWIIEYDNSQMTSLGISTAQIKSAISTYFSSEHLRMAQLKDDNDTWTRLAIASPGNDTELDLSKIFVTVHDGQIITLDKIAKAVHREAKPSSYFRINGLNSIYLKVTASEDANQIELSNKVKKHLAEMKLPDGYMLNLSYDSSENISNELDKIYFRTGLTVLILLMFVGLITMSWRYLTLISISLTINMAIAVVVYYMLNVEIQLYSLAGITISLNLVIDNLIVMTEHIMRRHNLKAFTAILAATLTTIGALSVALIFLDEAILLNLKDFVLVVIINLVVSLAIALFLIPALVQWMKLSVRPSKRKWPKKVQLKLMHIYSGSTRFLCAHRAPVFVAFILAFGLPVFMLPENVVERGTFSKLYNSTLGSSVYKKNIRPWVCCCLGGTLRLFSENAYDGARLVREDDDPTISINATLPNGATLEQMNTLISKMEDFLSNQEGINQFHTSVFGPRRSSITIKFKPSYRHTSYPFRLKSEVVSKALTLGGGSWSVYGLENTGFNNDIHESAGSFRIALTGYNYDELYSHAEIVCDSLLTYKRIKEITINSEFSDWKDDYTEFYLSIDNERIARDSISMSELFDAISRETNSETPLGRLSTARGSESIKLSPANIRNDVWAFMNIPIMLGKRVVKLSDYASIERRQTPPDILKYNQEYVLCIQYNYIGSAQQGDKLLNKIVKSFSNTLPMGYRIERDSYKRRKKDSLSNYALLSLVAIVIFFISAILFNTLRQPLAIILIIPASFIGVFLTFYGFNIKFGQGGFASLILLCGITVNAAIYIINEYNSLLKNFPHVSPEKLYFRAFRAKITAILLTIMSTVLGFIPFLIGDIHDSFWFSLAAGTIGGSLFSLVAIIILLPLIIRKSRFPQNPEQSIKNPAKIAK